MTLHLILFTIYFLYPQPLNCQDYEDYADLYGGHSREFRSIDEPIDWDLISGKSHKNIRSVTPPHLPPFMPSDQEIRDFIHSYSKPKEFFVQNVEELFNGTKVYISVRIKSFHSLKNKLIRKNDTLKRIRDTIGLRLTFQTVSGVKNAMLFLNRTTEKKFTIIEIRCYGICDPISKYSTEGYRRIHVIVKIDKYDKWAEIQMGTPYCSMWSDWNHDFLYKGEIFQTNDTSIRFYAQQLAQYFYDLDEARDHLITCPSHLAMTRAIDVLDPEVYHYLYEPESLCFYWNDIYLGKTNAVPTLSLVSSNGFLCNPSLFVILGLIMLYYINYFPILLLPSSLF